MAIEQSPILYDDATWPFHDEDDMPESAVQDDALGYLKAVLDQHYRADGWYIRRNYAIWYTNPRKPLSPDLALFPGVVVSDPHRHPSWRIAPPTYPAPQVVFEIASESTWELDFRKVPVYGRWGVDEVYIYDPGIPRIWRKISTRLRGWRRLPDGTMRELAQDAEGRLWSVVLDSWLVQDGDYLRLADRDGTRRPTGEEAGMQMAAVERAAFLTERLGRIQAEMQAESERAAANVERAARAEAERKAVKAERKTADAERKAAAQAAKLRELGIDPDSL